LSKEAAVQQAPIGVFDSGLGGLAVARQVMDILPEEDIVYFSDFKNLPYGPRPQEEVKGFTLRVVDFLLSQGAKAVLIGCNTASAAGAAAAGRRSGEVPVLGMIEPAVRATLAVGGVTRVGVIATLGTIQSGAYESAFRAVSDAVAVYGQACPTILRLAEQADIGDTPKIRRLAKECVAPLEAEKVQALILGCTDFTCITADIEAVLEPGIRLVDPAVEIVRTADRLLREKGWRRREQRRGTIRFSASAPGPASAAGFAQRIFGIDYRDVAIVDL
jgi:glutamate racemase